MGLVVDNFAGGGGASVGLERALGRKVDIAINHDGDAIAMHIANHPETQHFQEDVFAIDPAKACRGQAIDVAWFSPDCRHFSKAKGKRPVSKQVRGLAWVALRWASLPEWQRPQLIILENVEEFLTWGPLKGDRPCPERAGETFRIWKGHLEALGYTVDYRVLRACDYGAPTIRKRLFIIARRDGEPIRWPEPTHGDPRTKGFRKSGLKPWRTAAEIIDWSIPCPSIFLTKEQGRAIGVKRPLADATLRRIARGIQRYVIDTPEPFLVQITQTGSGAAPRSIRAPLNTITTAKGGEFALVTPTLVQTGYGERDGQAPRALDIHAPLGTVVAGGAKHALVAAFLTQHNAGPNNANLAGRSVDAPVSTVTATGSQQGLVTSHLIKLRGTCADGQVVTEPLPTITAGGTHVGEVRAFLIKYFGTDQDPRLEEPLHTVTTKDRFGLVTVMVGGEPYVIVDIGLRMLTEEELAAAQGFPADYILRPLINGKPMSKSASIARIGNSVCPDVAEAVARANAPMFSILQRSAA